MAHRTIPESELVLNPDGSVYHLHVKADHIADTVILVGDPGRVDQVTSFLESIEIRVSNREFCTVTGSYGGSRFTVLSTGIGTDNIDIVLNELDAAVNIDPVNRTRRDELRSLNLIRIGTTGSLHADIPVDSHILSSYGLGFDGLVYFYNFYQSDNEIDINNNINKHLNWNSNLATPYVVAADDSLASRLGMDMHQGITATATGFYGPQGRELRLTLGVPDMHSVFQSFEDQGLRITNFEMETSALYALGRMLGHRCCTCCAVIANRVTKTYSKDYKPVINNLIETVLQRMSEGSDHES